MQEKEYSFLEDDAQAETSYKDLLYEPVDLALLPVITARALGESCRKSPAVCNRQEFLCATQETQNPPESLLARPWPAAVSCGHIRNAPT